MYYIGPGFLYVVMIWLLPISSQQVVSLSQSSCVLPVELTDWGGGGSQIIRRRERLVLYNTIHILWVNCTETECATVELVYS
jgi:hypothetical protein